MGNIGIAFGGGRAFSAPAWFVLLIIVLIIVGLNHIINKVKN